MKKPNNDSKKKKPNKPKRASSLRVKRRLAEKDEVIAAWSLWNQYLDDSEGGWGRIAAGCVRKSNVTARQGAVHLLMEFWKEQLEDGDLDQFHWINERAYLSVADLMSIAREVW